MRARTFARVRSASPGGAGIDSGQTCVAPDYLLVPRGSARRVRRRTGGKLKGCCGDDALRCAWWPHMINKRRFDAHGAHRTTELDIEAHFKWTRRTEKWLKIEPTCVVGHRLEQPGDGRGDFRPVLPVITFSTLEDAFDIVQSFEKPWPCTCSANRGRFGTIRNFGSAVDHQRHRRSFGEQPYGFQQRRQLGDGVVLAARRFDLLLI